MKRMMLALALLSLSGAVSAAPKTAGHAGMAHGKMGAMCAYVCCCEAGNAAFYTPTGCEMMKQKPKGKDCCAMMSHAEHQAAAPNADHSAHAAPAPATGHEGHEGHEAAPKTAAKMDCCAAKSERDRFTPHACCMKAMKAAPKGDCCGMGNPKK
jgi:hypothetical protein